MNMEQALIAAGPLEASVRPRCGNCAHIGEHGWGLPYDEKRCKKLEERKADFDAAAAKSRAEPIDWFRFRPTDGVLPYSSAEKCRHYKRANVGGQRSDD